MTHLVIVSSHRIIIIVDSSIHIFTSNYGYVMGSDMVVVVM